MSPVELEIHELRDVDAVDDELVDVAGHVDIDEGGVDNLDAGQVAVDEPRAARSATMKVASRNASLLPSS